MNREVKKRFTTTLPGQFFRRVVLVQLLLTILAALTTAFLARYYLKTSILNQSEDQLHSSLRVIKDSIVAQRQTPLSLCYSIRFDPTTRYSLLSWDGSVLCDTAFDYRNVENLAESPDVMSAKIRGEGTLLVWNKKEKNLYGTIVIGDEENLKERYILRQSINLKTVEKSISSFDKIIITIIVPLLAILTFLSLWVGLRLAFPLRSLIRKIQNIRDNMSKEESYLLGPRDDWVLMEKTIEKAGQDLERYVDELFQENEKVRTLVESISDPILAINKAHRLIFANKSFKERLLPRDTTQEQLSTLKIWELSRHADVQALFEKVFESGLGISKPDVRIPTPESADILYCNLTITPLKDFHQRVFGAICVFHDISYYKKAQQMREDFVANVSHEVRTPLTALKGYVHMLRSSKCIESDALASDCLKRIENNSERVMNLFKDVLNLSMIEAKGEITKELIPTQEITESVLENVRHNYPQKNLVVSIEYGIEEVYAEPMLFEQVLTNLIDNAFKYTLNEGKVDIQWYRKDQMSVFQIKDSGVGMGAEHLPRLFERFYRVDPSRSEFKGTGLGLAIVKHIVQKHRGKISVTSRINEGTTFIVQIPKKEA